jgi:hypothetical protein
MNINEFLDDILIDFGTHKIWVLQRRPGIPKTSRRNCQTSSKLGDSKINIFYIYVYIW